MFIGHYAVGFIIKKKAKYIPLWILFIAVQFVDILWIILFSLGIEKASFNVNENVFLHQVYDYFPYSHSLFANLIIVLIVYILIRKYKNKDWALWISLAVLSHWFLDVIVHTPDMPLFLNNFKVGFGIWKHPLVSLIGEISFLLLSAFIYLWDYGHNVRLHIRLLIFLFIVNAIYLANYFSPAIAPTNFQIITTSLFLLFSIAFGGYLLERKTT